MDLSDQQLILACRTGDEQAWQLLLDRYERLVYSIPLNYQLSLDDAADITQNVFMALMQSLATLRDDSNLAGWLALVARRQTWRVLQRKRRMILEDVDDEAVAALLPAATNEIQRWEMVEWLNSALNLLDNRCREMLVALFFEPNEPSYVEVAQRLGLAVGSISATRARCLQRMHDLLKQAEP